MQGTVENTETDSDAWVQIESPVSITSTIELDRNGLSYEDGSQMESGIAVGNVEYVDDFDNTRIVDVTLKDNLVPNFITNSAMYDDQRESFVD